MAELYLGIDLGGTNTKLGVCSEAGEILGRTVIPTDPARGPVDTLKRVSAAAQTLIASTGPARACGCGIPGPLDLQRRFLLRAVNLPGWTDVQLPDVLTDALGLPTFLENDANCAAWAEYQVGAGRGTASLVLYTLGTGVGGGIVLHNEVWLGANGGAGRLGHTAVDQNGPECGCGQRGCLELYASASAVARSYGRGTAKDAFDDARRGQVDAIEVVDRACNALAVSVASIIQIIQPEIVVLGGGMAAAGDLLLDGVRAGLHRHVRPRWLERIRVELTGLRGDAGWIGAALWAKHRYDMKG